jgi:hypothetical protein
MVMPRGKLRCSVATVALMASATWMLFASACLVRMKPTASLPLKRWSRVCSA